jgi:hypothetical protein
LGEFTRSRAARQWLETGFAAGKSFEPHRGVASPEVEEGE